MSILFLSLLFYDYTNTISIHHICSISLTRGNEFRNYWPNIFEAGEGKASDEWCRERLSIDGFNEACKNISAISLKVRDESMGAIVFQTTAKGNLPHLSHDLCKTEPPGT